MYFDPLYILMAAPAFAAALIAQLIVKITYNKYSQVPNSTNYSGVDVVEKIMRKKNVNLQVTVSHKNLSDSYNPFSDTLCLSEKVAYGPSVASVGIAAHEMGHVIQNKKGFFLFNIRNIFVPVVRFGTSAGMILFLIGLSLNYFGLSIIGVALFGLSTIFTIITLPIEIDASRRALKFIKNYSLLDPSQYSSAKKVLFAASLTYVAAVMQSVSTFVYYLLRAFGTKRD